MKRNSAISSEEKIINALRETVADHESSDLRILEFGMGKGAYSRKLRKAFPNAFIATFDLPPLRIKKDHFEIVDEIIVRSIHSKKYPKMKEGFDLVTLGSHRMEPGFHFGFMKPDNYKKVLNALNYYLKPKGNFFIVLKSRKIDNIQQENHFARELDKEIALEKKGWIWYDQVTDLTESTLNDIGQFDFKETLVLDEDVIEKGRLIPRTEMLKMQFDINIYTQERYDKYLPRCIEIDKSIEEHGEEYGYFKIQTAVKRTQTSKEEEL